MATIIHGNTRDRPCTLMVPDDEEVSGLTLTAGEFEKLAARLSMRPVGLQMARRILVDGVSAEDAGREARKSRAEASRAEWCIRIEALRHGQSMERQ